MNREFDTIMKPIPTTQQGWVCPKCNASNSPLVQQCPTCISNTKLPSKLEGRPRTTYCSATYGQQLLTEHGDTGRY